MNDYERIFANINISLKVYKGDSGIILAIRGSNCFLRFGGLLGSVGSLQAVDDDDQSKSGNGSGDTNDDEEGGGVNSQDVGDGVDCDSWHCLTWSACSEIRE